MTLSGEDRSASAVTSIDAAPTARLPRWPLVALFAFYPVWWLLGVVDVIWIPAAALMALYMVRARAMSAPRGFGWWLLFLLWSGASAMEVHNPMRLAGFGYRFMLYVAGAVILLYIYNERKRLTTRFVTGTMTVFWLITVVGGYLGLLLPTATIRTPMSYVLPGFLSSNELVSQMVVRHFAQYNPDGYVQIDPRPSAPFLYTNNWGNVYSLVLPFVIVYLAHVRRERKFWLLLAALVASFVPAFLTLNRGMFLGLGIAIVYAAVRLASLGHWRALATVASVTILGGAAFLALPAGDRLDHRLEVSSTTEDRASLYEQAIDGVRDSPFFGYGAPRPSENPNAPSVGTQGQFWLVLYSHGIGGVLLFVGWFVSVVVRSLRRTDLAGIAANTILVVATVELLYYGFLPNGLPLVMVAAALALRPPDVLSRPAESATGTSRGDDSGRYVSHAAQRDGNRNT